MRDCHACAAATGGYKYEEIENNRSEVKKKINGVSQPLSGVQAANKIQVHTTQVDGAAEKRNQRAYKSRRMNLFVLCIYLVILFKRKNKIITQTKQHFNIAHGCGGRRNAIELRPI